MSAGVLEFDLSQIKADIRDFPDGAYYARVVNAEPDVSKTSGNPMLVITFEVSSEEWGQGEIREYLTANNDFGRRKAKVLAAALADVPANQVAEWAKENQTITFAARDLIGGELIIHIADQERKETGKVYKSIVNPFYSALSEAEEILG